MHGRQGSKLKSHQRSHPFHSRLRPGHCGILVDILVVQTNAKVHWTNNSSKAAFAAFYGLGSRLALVADTLLRSLETAYRVETAAATNALREVGDLSDSYMEVRESPRTLCSHLALPSHASQHFELVSTQLSAQHERAFWWHSFRLKGPTTSAVSSLDRKGIKVLYCHGPFALISQLGQSIP